MPTFLDYTTTVDTTVQGSAPVVKPTRSGMKKPAAKGSTSSPFAYYMTNTWNLLNTQATTAQRMLATYGPALIEVMYDEATVGSCFRNLVDDVLSGDIQITSALSQTTEADADETSPAGEDQVEIDLAEEIAAYCRRQVARLDFKTGGTFAEIARQGAHAARFCATAFEVVLGDPEPGPDAGRPTLEALLPRSQYSWSFARDETGKLIGYKVSPAEGAELSKVGDVSDIAPPEKFLVFVFCPDTNAPNGRSLFNMAIPAWNFLVNIPAPQWRHMMTFGMPVKKGTLPENPEIVEDPDNPGSDLDPGQAMGKQLDNLDNFSSLVLPFGASYDIVESKSDGSIFSRIKAELKREIAMAILGTALGTMEAEHYGKATAESGQDVTSRGVKAFKRWLAETIKHGLMKTLVRMAWDEQTAERLTPNVQLGMIDITDFSRIGNTFAKMSQAKLVPPQMILPLWSFLGAGALTKGISTADVIAWSQAMNEPKAPASQDQSTDQDKTD